MTSVRLVHFYLGVFFAPMILFFAFTGITQTFKLHETYRDVPDGKPNWVAWLGQIHKEQALKTPPAPRAKPPAGESSKAAKAQHKNDFTQPMKWFTAVMGSALMVSTLLGLYIAAGYRDRRRSVVVAFTLGLLIPSLLLAFERYAS